MYLPEAIQIRDKKEEGKDQESIQSDTTLPRTPYGKETKNINIQESQEVRLFPAGDHMAARNRQGNMTNTHETKKI